jgi:hypothetical protein
MPVPQKSEIDDELLSVEIRREDRTELHAATFHGLEFPKNLDCAARCDEALPTVRGLASGYTARSFRSPQFARA